MRLMSLSRRQTAAWTRPAVLQRMVEGAHRVRQLLVLVGVSHALFDIRLDCPGWETFFAVIDGRRRPCC